MRGILENLKILEKNFKMDKENKQIYQITCFQAGCKNLLIIKHINYEDYEKLNIGDEITVETYMTVWGTPNSYGLSLKWVGLR